jgi:3-oxoacyl-ACP reductase-like protein
MDHICGKGPNSAFIARCLEAELVLQAVKSPESLSDTAHVQGIIDLDKDIVITGFAEIGPWGSSQTRWEMEARGEFKIKGCISMAWMMGYIKHFNGHLKGGLLYIGWVDSKNDEPANNKDVRGHYEKEILTYVGVRLDGEL